MESGGGLILHGHAQSASCGIGSPQANLAAGGGQDQLDAGRGDHGRRHPVTAESGTHAAVAAHIIAEPLQEQPALARAGGEGRIRQPVARRETQPARGLLIDLQKEFGLGLAVGDQTQGTWGIGWR